MAIPAFRNEICVDWSIPSNRKKQEQALASARAGLGKEYPIVIGGKRVLLPQKFHSLNPSKPAEIVGIFQKGDGAVAQGAIDAAASAFEKWKDVPFTRRADFLFKGAKLMRKRRFDLNAVMILEVGKSWAEADADTAEAIDFLEYYGREILRYGTDHRVEKVAGEKGKLVYIPLGVGIIIPPWNFPLAILVGTTMSAVAAGNAVVLKPSSDSPLTGWKFVEIMEDVGLPPGVINFVTGPGGAVGDILVQHPKTRFVSFTGSKEGGIHIYETAAKVQPGQAWLKRVVAEMGGKDSIVVDESSDLEDAAKAVVASAFGFQGQKCSACSRVIVHESVYHKFVELLSARTGALRVGDVTDPQNTIGPVVNKRAQESILGYIEKGIREGGRLVAGGTSAGGEGYFIRPTVIADVDPSATIAQEEIFGPVLTVIKAKNFDDALAIANNTEYGLTGAIFSRNRKNIARAEKEFFVGNLYVNRKCTGALVGAHPFGGFNMSGTDSKAGGQDYLLLFLQAKAIAEKIKA